MSKDVCVELHGACIVLACILDCVCIAFEYRLHCICEVRASVCARCICTTALHLVPLEVHVIHDQDLQGDEVNGCRGLG